MIAQTALESFYLIAGRAIRISADDEWSASAVSTLLARCYFELKSHEAADVDLHVSCAEPPPVPEGLHSFEILGGTCRTDGESLYLLIDDSLVKVGSGSPQVEIWLGKKYDFGSSILANIFWQAFGAALRRCDLFELHSGGVVFPENNKALLICGPSGSGKSTITWQLAACGWDYLSDDRLLLSETESGIEARALRRFFALTAGTMTAVGINSPTRHLNGDKQRLVPQDYFSGEQVHSASPAAIVFPVITHEAESRLEPLGEPETMQRLLRICPWACYDKPIAGPHLRLLQRLAGQAAGFDLFAGKDLLGDSEHTAKLISSIRLRN